jgi:hypothetical protein
VHLFEFVSPRMYLRRCAASTRLDQVETKSTRSFGHQGLPSSRLIVDMPGCDAWKSTVFNQLMVCFGESCRKASPAQPRVLVAAPPAGDLEPR